MQLTYQALTGPYAEKLDKYFGIKGSLVEVNPGKVLLPPQFVEIGQSIIDASVREDDIWMLSYPRTGSTWAQEMVWLIGNDLNYEKARSAIQHLRTPLIELSAVLVNDYKSFMSFYGNSVDVVNGLPSPRYIKSHLPWTLLPKQLDEVKPKIIYVARNPKDMCVSYYHYCQLVHDMKATFEEFCELFLNNKAPVGSVWTHYLGFWKQRHQPNIMFLKYEDMKRDLRTVIKNTVNFLEKPPMSNEQIDQLIEHLSFNSMKNNPAVNLKPIMEMKNGKDFYERTGKTFIRKGQIGDWKNYMTPELSKRFDEWTAENLKETGLNFD